MFLFKALFPAMALLEQDSLCLFGLTKTFRFGGGWLQALFLMVGGVAPDGMRNGGTAACCNNEMRVGQKSRLVGWELLLLSERAILTSDAPSWVAICHTGDAALSRG